ncbi:MAG TPA: cytochrome c oxidase subunit II [Planctomycetota bacterium]|nr:cytochrome c oxidase subunit II [Planctomycetota bacterium]
MDEFIRKLLNLPVRGASYAAPLDHLHYSVIGVTMFGSCAVAAAALWFMIRYARPTDVRVRTARVSAPLLLELGVVFGLLGLFVIWWDVGFRLYVDMMVPPADATPVYVLGKQWMWKFDYPTGPGSVGDLYVPADRPIKVLATSRDVIHSFFVPAFRFKIDAVPGGYSTGWFRAPHPGTYDIYCAEYCGTSHSRMLGRVVVLSTEDFDRWRSGREGPGHGPAQSDLADAGRVIAGAKGCINCHSVDGSRHLGPTWLGLFGKEEELVSGERVLVDEAYITESMMDPLQKVVKGYAPLMPSFQGRVTPADTASIIEYMRSLSEKPLPPREERHELDRVR